MQQALGAAPTKDDRAALMREWEEIKQEIESLTEKPEWFKQ